MADQGSRREGETQYVCMQKQKIEVFKEKDNLGFGLRTEMPFNILPGTKSLWVPQPARVLLCPHLCLFPRVAWRSLATAKCALRGFEQPVSAAP